MSVKVIRKKERLTSQWSELEVYVDGEKRTAIYGNDSSEIQLKEETGELKVKQILSKSAKKQVSNGDVVEVSNSPIIKYAFYLMPVLVLLMFMSSAVDLLNFWILTVVAAAYITFILSIKPLQIKDITEESEEQDENLSDRTE